MSPLNEDTLVQQTTADYLETQLGWDSVFAYNNETFGAEGTLGRQSDKDVVLTRYLGEALVKLNPGLPDAAYHDALRQMIDAPVSQNSLQINREHYERVKNGVPVQYRNNRGDLEKKRLKVFDFETPENNHFLCVRELWVRGGIYRRRADIVGFVNGLPLLFIECKTLHKDIRHAFEKNLCDYKDTVPHLFHHNALIILANGVDAKVGSVSSRFEHFNDWKRLAEEDPGVVDMETLLKGVCNKRNFIDLFESFIVFDESKENMVKIVARNHQFLGVNRAIDAVKHRKERNGKLGVFWHTQGSGKSYSMVFFTRKIHRRLGSNFTFLICTDRDDLDGQIYKTYAGCGLVDNDRDPCRAGSGEHLKALLNQHKAYVFTLVQKFNQDVNPDDPYSERDDVIVITDEAHRTQYGRLSLNLRNALPHASYIGFTGTPLFKDDEITRRVFGEYISTYDFQRAVEDNATVPLYYDARGEKLGIATSELNERIAEKLEEIEIDDIDTATRLENELKRDYHLITARSRLRQIAEDFVTHYSTQWETGKAMLVCIDKVTCVRMHGLILARWNQRIAELEQQLEAVDEQAAADLSRQIDWMCETRMAVVISEEQGEVDKFRKWDLDITPHRRLIKEGFETDDGKRIDIETAFKKEDHPFRIAIVCAMWLTGFDVPSLSTLYLDKPLKAHTLMQAIARANRVNEGKNNGLIVDYCGILKNLRKALATFAGYQGSGMDGGSDIPPEIDPMRPEAELLADLEEAIDSVRAFLQAQNFRLEEVLEKTGFDRNRAIVDAKEAVNQNDETRKRFEIICREVFKKFKACLTIKDINRYRHAFDAINIIYKSLQEDAEKADISNIIRELHRIIEENIEPVASGTKFGIEEERQPYDISRINFKRLKKEFERAHAKNTIVHDLKMVIEKKLFRMMQQNPTRTDFQKHFEQIIEAYNQEKNRAAIEQTFEDMMRFAETLNEEDKRAAREGLDEESLALFDLLFKPDLSRQEIDRLKQVATGLYQTLQAQLAQIQDFAAKQSTRDEVKVFIKNYLWDENTGLPEGFLNEEIEEKADVVFAYVLMSARHSQSIQNNARR